MSLAQLNPKAETIQRTEALSLNISAALGIQSVLKTNLGPKGTLKMLVGGAGQIKLTKDGGVLLHEMQIQHPTAGLIARTATAQDDITGDGTTSVVLFTGDLLRSAYTYIQQGIHPRIITDGFNLAKTAADEFLTKSKVMKPDCLKDRELLCCVARTALRTKLQQDLADQVTEIVTDAVLCVARPDLPIDLDMVEKMQMENQLTTSTRLVKGLVLDHGGRHPDMPKVLKNAYIFTCNVSLEYEKSEVTSNFVYSNAGERDNLVEAERKFTDEKVLKIIELKKQVCTPENGYTFVIINQKGIDPISLDLLAKEGILALRRAKRRNMERLTLSCGGIAVNSVDDLKPDTLGFAGSVYEETLGDDVFTFVEDVKNPTSCTILIKGPNPHSIVQIKDAINDGLQAVKNTIEDGCLIPGAGAFELALYDHLMEYSNTLSGKVKLGVKAYAEAILIIPKTLIENSGLDIMDTLLKVQEARPKSAKPIGININNGNYLIPEDEGIWDNYLVKKQFIQLSTVIASQLLLVDEIMRAGKDMGKKNTDEIPTEGED